MEFQSFDGAPSEGVERERAGGGWGGGRLWSEDVTAHQGEGWVEEGDEKERPHVRVLLGIDNCELEFGT